MAGQRKKIDKNYSTCLPPKLEKSRLERWPREVGALFPGSIRFVLFVNKHEKKF